MAKAVFRPGELVNISEKIMISSPDLNAVSVDMPHESSEDAEAQPQEEVYAGPTAEELRREAEAFTEQWNTERETMIQTAKDEAAAIVQAAEQTVSEERQHCSEEIAAMKAAAQAETEKILADAKQKAEELETETRKNLDNERKEAFDQGKEDGRLEGFAEGKIEVDRLIERTQIVLERAQDKRGDILAETEQEIVNLVLLITRKVVKVISENQREVIISNVVQALRKVRDRGNIIIRVNLADLKLATEHTKNFIQMMEGVKSIQVAEDSSVDPGGCVIETDFGEVDARISSQLAEMESKILEASPIKARMKVPAAARPK